MYKDKPHDMNLSQISETGNQRTSKSNKKSNSQSKASQEETSKTRQIKDVEMKESEHYSRSPSPKGRVKTNVPVLPNR